MKSLRHLNKFNFIVIIFTFFIFNNVLAEDEPADIWETNDLRNETNTKVSNEETIKLENPILLENESEAKIQIEEDEIE